MRHLREICLATSVVDSYCDGVVASHPKSDNRTHL